MPIYTYECEECGARFEAKQSFNDAPLTVCPTCEGKIHRVIQPVGVVFKGSGFYVNDSRSKQNLATTASGAKKEDGKSADGGTTEAAATTTKSEGTADSSTAKPAAETATPVKSTASSDTSK